MLGIDERRQATGFLSAGNDMEHESRLARGFRPKNLDDPPARHSADSQGKIECESACRNHSNLFKGLSIPKAHDAAVPVGFRNR